MLVPANALLLLQAMRTHSTYTYSYPCVHRYTYIICTNVCADISKYLSKYIYMYIYICVYICAYVRYVLRQDLEGIKAARSIYPGSPGLRALALLVPSHSDLRCPKIKARNGSHKICVGASRAAERPRSRPGELKCLPKPFPKVNL